VVIGACVTCTDPILSQAIAKGPFADKFVARHLPEIISSEAGANDGFGFPFLMLATYLILYAGAGGFMVMLLRLLLPLLRLLLLALPTTLSCKPPANMPPKLENSQHEQIQDMIISESLTIIK
jgi:NhaP-type Na+/H+ or K+/H+ antiporter